MMESFWLAVNVVFPLLVYMAVGFAIRKRGIFTVANFKAQNRMIFHIFLPLTLFFNIYDADIDGAIKPGIFVFVFVAILFQFLLLWVVLSHTVRNRADCATMIQGIYRSNFVLFGNVVASSLCGEAGLALVAALSALVVPMFNVLAVVLFELKREKQVHPLQLVGNIFKNPLVDAGLLGIIFKALHIPLPTLLHQPLVALGNIATPLALVSLGGMLTVGSIMRHKKYLIAAAVGKLALGPLAALAVAILLGYRDDVIVACLAIFASPTAVGSAPMAQAMGGNGELAGEIVAVTSVLSMLSIFGFVFFLSHAGFI